MNRFGKKYGFAVSLLSAVLFVLASTLADFLAGMDVTAVLAYRFGMWYLSQIPVDIGHYLEDEWLNVRNFKKGGFLSLHNIALNNEHHHFYPKGILLKSELTIVSEILAMLPAFLGSVIILYFFGYDMSSVTKPLEVWSHIFFVIFNHAQCHCHPSQKYAVIRFAHDHLRWFVKNSDHHREHHLQGNAGFSGCAMDVNDWILDAIGAWLKRQCGVEHLYPGKKPFAEYRAHWSGRMEAFYERQTRGESFSEAEKADMLEHVQEVLRAFIGKTQSDPYWAGDRRRPTSANLPAASASRRSLEYLPGFSRSFFQILCAVSAEITRRVVRSSLCEGVVGSSPDWLSFNFTTSLFVAPGAKDTTGPHPSQS
jgi:hypothetical protein